MPIDLQTKDVGETGHHVSIEAFPDSCPSCHRSIHPKFIDMRVQTDKSSSQVVFQCANRQCQKLFVSTYGLLRQNGGRLEYRFRYSEPVSPLHHTFPDVIQIISPTFCLIFSQAEQAESQKLDQLVGIGLRKALEFLVKDFAKSEYQDKADAIQKSLLGSCIDKYLNDENIKQCAKRAAWLGNDETHYVKKVGEQRYLRSQTARPPNS